MPYWLLALVGFAVVLAGALLWFGWRWLSRSWEVLDDGQLEARLAGHKGQSGGRWHGMRRWFAPKPLQLPYRRDKLGRFRKIHRW